jgi:hypothetical protein
MEVKYKNSRSPCQKASVFKTRVFAPFQKLTKSGLEEKNIDTHPQRLFFPPLPSQPPPPPSASSTDLKTYISLKHPTRVHAISLRTPWMQGNSQVILHMPSRFSISRKVSVTFSKTLLLSELKMTPKLRVIR